MPSVPKTPSGKSRRRHSVWKAVEREAGKWAYKHDGPDPAMANNKWVSSTGRVANTTQAQHDIRSLHYCGECKAHEELPKWLWTMLAPVMAGDVSALVLKLPKCPLMVLITPECHADLLAAERGERAYRQGFTKEDSRDSAPEWLTTAWLQITQVAHKNNRHAWLYLRQPHKGAIHVLTVERYNELVGYEAELAA